MRGEGMRVPGWKRGRERQGGQDGVRMGEGGVEMRWRGGGKEDDYSNNGAEADRRGDCGVTPYPA